MSSVVQITPAMGVVPTSAGPVPIAQLDLGGVPRGAVIVVADGDDFPNDATHHLNELAAHGYEGVAADLSGLASDDAALLEIAQALIAHVGQRDWQPEQIGLIGYGIGGRLALVAGAHIALGATISISMTGLSSGTSHLDPRIGDLAERLRTPWLGVFGAADTAAPKTACRELDDVLQERSAVYGRVVRYPGVGPNFFREPREALEISAAYDAQQRVIEWLNARVEPRLTPLAVKWRCRMAA